MQPEEQTQEEEIEKEEKTLIPEAPLETPVETPEGVEVLEGIVE